MTAPRGPRPGGARPGRPRADPAPAAACPSTARGALLVGVLVIAGIVGLQIIDDSGAGNEQLGTVDATTATSVDSTVDLRGRPPAERGAGEGVQRVRASTSRRR